MRRHAVHALSCDACKAAPLGADVAGPLRRCVAEDPNPKVRLEALRALLARATGDETASLLTGLAQDPDLLAEINHARPGSLPEPLRGPLAAT